MFGWLIRFPEDASTGVYHKVVARIGFFVFCLMLGFASRLRQVTSKQVRVIVFSFLWMFVLYIPNWLFEPRLTMGITHRYMVLSSLGFVLGVAYLISLVRSRTLQVIFSLFFVIANFWMAHYYIGIASRYRSVTTVSFLWNTIRTDVKNKLQPYIFVYQGDDPVKTYALELSGPAPFGLIRQISNVYDLPVVTEDTALIEKLLCFEGMKRFVQGSVVVQKEIIPLNHVYAWRVSTEGTLTNITLPTRRELLIKAMDDGCVPMID
jgi:hypothetical protein